MFSLFLADSMSDVACWLQILGQQFVLGAQSCTSHHHDTWTLESSDLPRGWNFSMFPLCIPVFQAYLPVRRAALLGEQEACT